MKQSPSHVFSIATLFLIAMLASCTKEKNADLQQQQKSVLSDDALLPGESSVDTLAFGTYTIVKFIDSSVDHTSQFADYIFKFEADDVFIAKKGSQKFEGKWHMNNDDTKMMIDITGNPRLDDLDGDWHVARLTDQRLSIVRKGPDKVVFRKQE